MVQRSISEQASLIATELRRFADRIDAMAAESLYEEKNREDKLKDKSNGR